MDDFNAWLGTQEGAMLLEQCNCDADILEKVWNASKVTALNGVMSLVAEGVLTISQRKSQE